MVRPIHRGTPNAPLRNVCALDIGVETKCTLDGYFLMQQGFGSKYVSMYINVLSQIQCLHSMYRCLALALSYMSYLVVMLVHVVILI